MSIAPRSRSERSVGRRAQFSHEDILVVGRRIGLPSLSVQAVAKELGVTTAAVYRHVPSRDELEQLVGESVLAELELPDEPSETVRQHLLGFALRLRAFCAAHPGAAGYFQQSFPRGPSGARLLAAEVGALVRRGYAPDAASALCGSVASFALAGAAADDARRTAAPRPEDRAAREQRVATALADDPTLHRAHEELPDVSDDLYNRIVMTAVIDGMVTHLPAGRSVGELVAEARAAEAADAARATALATRAGGGR